ncbi:threonine--tRNA ligase [Clostridium sp. 'deep sea']|uniref:threonine--tRNA ligase n=1 Tax=Clostridium sp. 'deep sea' TaxID=2779445 RepID=UPI0018967E7D|nr:threonine--tRNA ligase [Clostridium sp. 'deep sea']QOR35617.1 threonine--tRNA ligase [Clostridium sp. 'deep sea']
MNKITITLKDGSQRSYDKGITAMQIAKDISSRLAKSVVAAKVNDKLVDSNFEIQNDVSLDLITINEAEGLDIFRHSSAHIMAQAVKNLWPDAKLAIGPSIKDGFYYDFDMEHRLVPDDLVKIEAEMNKLIKQDLKFTRHELSREEAMKLFKEKNEPYKIELIKDLPEDAIITYYDQGDFLDLCAGPHIPGSKKIKAIKLMSIAGAYWRGDEKRPMLQRIYGTSWEKKSHLEEYLHRIEEAKRRDHRKLGRELDLFSLNTEFAPGFPFYHGKGMIVRNILEEYWRIKHDEYGYEEIRTPVIMNQVLWQLSGHWDNYRENMYTTEIDDNMSCIKPMNCPGSMLVYKTKMHSYRDLPLRMCELGLVHRHELSGALHGLMRVRAFTQDDAHVFMLPSQIEQEVDSVISLVDDIYKVFGFDYHVELSTKPEKAIGSDEDWEFATDSLRNVLEKRNMNYIVNEGDGAFYGPKIDFHLTDSLGRTWQCATIQLDMQMPERFELEYVGEDGQKHRPVTIHRTVLGSFERFFGVLIEHYAGAFPVWLAPVQVQVIPITDRHAQYALEVANKIKETKIRVEVDTRKEKVGFKIREAQLQKIPYMIIIGDKEVENNNVAIRQRSEGDVGSMELNNFIDLVLEEIKNKKIN